MKKTLLSLLTVIFIGSTAFTQTFEDINANLNDVFYTITTTGDFDNDSDTDLFLAGQLADGSDVSILYINNGDETFTPSTEAIFPDMAIGAAECADFNNDSWLDILVQAFNNETLDNYTKIFQNNGDGTFTELSLGLPQTYMGDVSCADFDNDGNIDIGICGFINESPYYISRIFKNNGDGTFSEVSTDIPGTMYGKFKWADYNNDSYQDFIITGWEDDFTTEIFMNNGDGTFTSSGIDIHKGWLGDVEWADYNNDGNIDLVVSGTGGDGDDRFCLLYKNNGDETFTEMNIGFPGVSHSALEWADFDNDNDIDLFICGTETTPGEGNYVSAIYLNEGGDVFSESTTANLPTVYWGDSETADFNNDGKPDLMLSGYDITETPYSAIFKNNSEVNSYAVTFRVNMSNEVISPNGVHIAGSFQDWDPAATLMTNTGNNTYEYTQSFDQGETLEFKFINGTIWGEDESVPGECAQNNNRFLSVPVQDTILTAVCFGSCSPCGDAVTVIFNVDMSEQIVSPDGIHLVGSFQGWDPTSSEMTNTGNNIYSVSYNINSFEVIEYKFINGIDWPESEIVPEECGVPDGFDAFNRFLEVPDYDTALVSVCFGSCVPCITGIDNKIAQSEIKGIYPNPFSDNLSIEYYLTKKTHTEICIYNSIGKKIFEKNYSNKKAGMHVETFSLADLSKGVYFMILKSDGIVIQTEKVVK
ncbi:MAG: hypothetical protein DRJ05_13175 [Bacteroidetes bacterium]|nr:MAG: hypothetical protein DRJ05_13175 [Bacteroidota bacterium]